MTHQALAQDLRRHWSGQTHGSQGWPGQEAPSQAQAQQSPYQQPRPMEVKQIAVSAFEYRVAVPTARTASPSEGLIPSDLFTPDLEPTTGQLEISLPIPYSFTSTNAPGYASGGSWPAHAGCSPVTTYDAQGQAPTQTQAHAHAQVYAQTRGGSSPVDVLSEKWGHLFGHLAQSQYGSQSPLQPYPRQNQHQHQHQHQHQPSSSPSQAVRPPPGFPARSPMSATYPSNSATPRRVPAPLTPPGLHIPAFAHTSTSAGARLAAPSPAARTASLLSPTTPSFSPSTTPHPAAAAAAAAATAQVQSQAPAPVAASNPNTPLARSFNRPVIAKPPASAGLVSSASKTGWPTPAEVIVPAQNKVKVKQSKEQLVARKVDEALMRNGRGTFKGGHEVVKEISEADKGSSAAPATPSGGAGFTAGEGPSDLSTVRKNAPASLASPVDLSSSSSRLKQSLSTLTDAQTRMTARISELEHTLSLSLLKAEAASRARAHAEAAEAEAKEDRRTAISAAQKLKLHLELALADLAKVKEERDGVKAQAELEAAQARQRGRMADERAEGLERELRELRELRREREREESVVVQVEEGVEEHGRQRVDQPVTESRKVDEAQGEQLQRDTGSDDDTAQKLQAAQSELDRQSTELAELKRLVQSYVTTTIHFGGENKRLQVELNRGKIPADLKSDEGLEKVVGGDVTMIAIGPGDEDEDEEL